MGNVVYPYLPLNGPDYPEIMEAIEAISDVYDEHAKRKERLGDFLFRVGLEQFTKWLGIEPSARQMSAPRTNAFYHWEPEELVSTNGNNGSAPQ